MNSGSVRCIQCPSYDAAQDADAPNTTPASYVSKVVELMDLSGVFGRSARSSHPMARALAIRAISKLASRIRSEIICRAWGEAHRFRREVTLQTEQGVFTVDTGDHVIPRHLLVDGHYEAPFMAAVVEALKGIGQHRPDRVLLDIGANIGTTTIGMLRNGYYASSVAFEPDPRNAELLRRNVVDNGLSESVSVVQAALSDRAGRASMRRNDGNFGDHRLSDEAGEVIVMTLDGEQSFRRDSIGLIWVDIQGRETHLLRGGQEVLRHGPPTVLEVWPSGIHQAGASAAELADYARAWWSDYWTFRHGRMVRYPIDAFDSLLDELSGMPDGQDFESVLFTHRR